MLTDDDLRKIMVEEYAKENYGAIQAGLEPEMRALRRVLKLGITEGYDRRKAQEPMVEFAAELSKQLSE